MDFRHWRRPGDGGWTVKTIAEASLHIMGGRTFRDIAGGLWPTSTAAFAPPMNQIPKASSLDTLTSQPVRFRQTR